MFIRYQEDAPKKPVNCSMNSDLVAKAKAMGINVSAAAEAGLLTAMEQAERRRIEEDTKALMSFWNDHEARFGTPADEYSEI
ncbi:MAG TPA: type II toxin-antitoxin system CcdA family antitoxin [Inquilinus sp.]|nr:type II toxin-antitoxin system CcdA family antitoxin [Inquilinus sp.]